MLNRDVMYRMIQLAKTNPKAKEEGSEKDVDENGNPILSFPEFLRAKFEEFYPGKHINLHGLLDDKVNHFKDEYSIKDLADKIAARFNTVNPYRIAHEDCHRLQKKLYSLNKYIYSLDPLSNEYTSLTQDRRNLLSGFNEKHYERRVLYNTIAELNDKYSTPTYVKVAKVMGAVLVAAAVAVGCAFLGALAGAALTSWSGGR